MGKDGINLISHCATHLAFLSDLPRFCALLFAQRTEAVMARLVQSTVGERKTKREEKKKRKHSMGGLGKVVLPTGISLLLVFFFHPQTTLKKHILKCWLDSTFNSSPVWLSHLA